MKREKQTDTHIDRHSEKKGDGHTEAEFLSNTDVLTDWPTEESERQKDKHRDTHRDRERQDSF